MMRYSQIAPFIICILGSFFYVYDYFLAVSPSVMTQHLLIDFGLDAGQLGSLLSIFFLASMFFQIPAGLLLDRLGARLLLSVAVLVSGLGTLLFAWATAPWELGAARLLMGMGSPFAFLGALFLASRWFSHRYFALIAGGVQLGGALGSMVGGGPLAYVVNALGWRAAMKDVGGITLFLALLFWLILRDGKPHIKVAPHYSALRWHHVLKEKMVWKIALVGFASWVTVTGVGSLWGIPYLMAVYHLSNTWVGYLYIVFWLGLGLGSPLMGWWSDHLKRRKMPFYVCFILGLMAAVLFIMAPYLPLWSMIFVLFFLGFAASVQSLSFGIAKDLVPHRYFVTASGFINLAAVLTGIVVQPLIGYVMGWHAQGQLSYTLIDYQLGFIVIPVFLLMGLMWAYFALPETHCQAVYEQHH